MPQLQCMKVRVRLISTKHYKSYYSNALHVQMEALPIEIMNDRKSICDKNAFCVVASNVTRYLSLKDFENGMLW